MKPFNVNLIVVLLIIGAAFSSCNTNKVKTTEEAVKFLESHQWNANECTMRLASGSETKMSTGCTFTFKDGKVTLWDQPGSYTISSETYPNGDGAFIVKFYDSKNGGTECFKLFDNGSAECYPDQGQEGVFADFNDNK